MYWLECTSGNKERTNVKLVRVMDCLTQDYLFHKADFLIMSTEWRICRIPATESLSDTSNWGRSWNVLVTEVIDLWTNRTWYNNDWPPPLNKHHQTWCTDKSVTTATFSLSEASFRKRISKKQHIWRRLWRLLLKTNYNLKNPRSVLYIWFIKDYRFVYHIYILYTAGQSHHCSQILFCNEC